MTLDLDFYLSEMSVSDRHGGGLTLQRVLGVDLDHIALFAHVSRFATEYPVCGKLETRCLDMPMWTESRATRMIVGDTLAAWLCNRQMIIRREARRIAARICTHASPQGEALRGLVCPQAAISLYVVEDLAERRPVEYLTWIMDDHLVRWINGEWRYPPQLEELFAKHLRRAKCVFVISPAMSKFIHERFGVDSEVLFGPADPSGDPRWEIARDDNRIRLGYFGAVGRWQTDSLSLLANALETAGASLDIYAEDNCLPAPLQVHGVRRLGRIEPAEVPSAMREYDAVVLPASFDRSMRNMTELNIATKMSECLASGTVTLFVGPRYAAIARFLEGTGAALIISENTSAAVADAIAKLRSREHRVALLKSARNLVQSKLSIRAMHEIWRKGAAHLN